MKLIGEWEIGMLNPRDTDLLAQLPNVCNVRMTDVVHRNIVVLKNINNVITKNKLIHNYRY